MRDGRIGLAPLGAVLSFVHREGPPADRVIVAHAGACAAEWTFGSLSGFRKRIMERLPFSLRVRAALGVGRALVLETIGRSKVVLHLKDGQGSVDQVAALRLPEGALVDADAAGSSHRRTLSACDYAAWMGSWTWTNRRQVAG